MAIGSQEVCAKAPANIGRFRVRPEPERLFAKEVMGGQVRTPKIKYASDSRRQ